jgi:hypothetical protein
MVVLVLLSGVCAAFGPGMSAAAPTPTPTSQPPNLGRVTAYALNVRTGPGTAYPLQNGGGLSLGDALEVVGKNATGDWLQIAYNEEEGWIAAAYVDLTGSLAAVRELSAPLEHEPHPKIQESC